MSSVRGNLGGREARPIPFVLVLRPIALRSEFSATVRTMVGVVAEAPESLREQFLAKRVGVLCRMPEVQRDEHVRCTLEGLRMLPEEKAMSMRARMMELLLQRPEEQRVALMRSMDKVMFAPQGGTGRRRKHAVG